MTPQGRDHFRAISTYVNITHILLSLAAVAAPAITLTLVPQAAPVTVTAMLCAVVAGVGSALMVAADFTPDHVLIRWARSARARTWMGIVVVSAASAVLFLVPDDGGPVTTAAVTMAWALRAVTGGSFWSGIARLFGATVACGAVTFALAILSDRTWEMLTIVVAALLALGVLGQDKIYTLAIELDDLRTLEAARAVVTERKRFAGDLHDIQGQHLSLITIEAELVSRLIATEDFPEAARHAEKLQGVAIDALDEMHRVVHANREVSLREEIANAVRVLESAGIDVAHDIAEISQLPVDQDRLLGLAVREAITNILKHSRAKSCTIEVRNNLRDSENGVTLVVADSGPAALHSVRTAGTGLKRLSERYRALGGELGFVRQEGGQLRGWLPTQNGDHT